MTWIQYTVCFIAALSGAAIHFVMDMKDSKKLAANGRYIWTARQFISDQKLSLIASFIWIGIVMLIFSEALAKYEALADWKKCIFLIMGYGGDSFASKILGTARDRALAVLNDKTFQLGKLNNTLDAPTPAVMPSDKK